VTDVAAIDRHDLVGALRGAGLKAGDPVALATAQDPGQGIGLAVGDRSFAVPTRGTDEVADAVRDVNAALAPRWVWWSARAVASPAVAVLGAARCWDVAAVHRLLDGGSADEPGQVWACVRGLPADALPRSGQLDLLSPAETAGPEGDPEDPVRPDGYLRPEWAETPPATPHRAARWAALALRVQDAQLEALARLPDTRRAPREPALPVLTAWAESAADLLAVALTTGGLPLDRMVAERLIAERVGPRAADPAAEAAQRSRRDDEVRALVPGGDEVDLRNPAQVRELLGRIGIDVPDTRSWRLEPLRSAHPAVDALLAWRKAERIATTYGYGWLDRHVGRDGRLRGTWTGSDGAAGRMTAQAGLHNLPAELRPAVVAEPGHVFVRADLGQIEPRVLAAVSGDDAFAAATRDADLYSPVAARIGCDRPTAKVAVLAAMYGQTSGAAGQALQGLERAYPVAMRHLRAAEEEGRAGRDVRTYGGRLVRMWPLPEPADPAAAAGRGRYARNAVVQGSAAELFKMWAVTVRAGLAATPDAEIVLCLHDELLVHVHESRAKETVALVHDALALSAATWAAGSPARFVVDVAVVRSWSDAKAISSTAELRGLVGGSVVRNAP
jgi:DNA polymerase-1